MDLKEVETKWDDFKQKEHALEEQLEKVRQDKSAFFRQAVHEGFYWRNGEWMKEEMN